MDACLMGVEIRFGQCRWRLDSWFDQGRGGYCLRIHWVAGTPEPAFHKRYALCAPNPRPPREADRLTHRLAWIAMGKDVALQLAKWSGHDAPGYLSTNLVAVYVTDMMEAIGAFNP